MHDSTWAPLKSFHADLLAISDSGLPLDLQLPASTDLLDATSQFESRFMQAAAQGKSLQQWLADDSELPSEYATALAAWLQAEQSPLAFEPLAANAVARRTESNSLRVSLVPPVVCAVLAYLSLIYLCSHMVASAESMSEQLHKPPGLALAILLQVRDWMPIWILALPIVLFSVLWLSMRRARRTAHGSSWLIKSGFSSFVLRSTATRRVAELLEAGLSIEPAMAMLPAVVRSAAPSSRGETNTTDRLPPLMAWAASGEPSAMEAEPTQTEQDRWRLASRLYDGLASIELERFQQPIAQKTLVILAGVLALGIGLSVFLPLIDLLLFVAGEEPRIR